MLHRRGAGVRGLPGEDGEVALDAEGPEHRRRGLATALEHGSLLDVQLDVGAAPRAARSPASCALSRSTPKRATTSSRRSPSRSRRSRTSSGSSVPAQAEDPNRLRPKRAPSSSAQSTSRSPTGGRPASACARSAPSAANTPSAPSSQPPSGTESTCEPTITKPSASPARSAHRLPAASSVTSTGSSSRRARSKLARAHPLVGPAHAPRTVRARRSARASSRRSASTRSAAITRPRRPVRAERPGHEAPVARLGPDLPPVVDERAAAERVPDAPGRGSPSKRS